MALLLRSARSAAAASARRLGTLTHVRLDAATGALVPSMVNVSGKAATQRFARATARVSMPLPAWRAFKAAEPAIAATVILTGTHACKRTPELIIACHGLPVESCDITLAASPPESEHTADAVGVVDISCAVSTTAKTGVEMEALTGASLAALALYDMLKAASHDIVVERVRLEEKRGGAHDFERRRP